MSPTLSQVTSTSGSDADKIYTPSASSSSSKVSTSVGTFQPTGFDKYPSLAEVTGAAPLDGPQLPCFMMSLTRNPSFFGRSEILDLIEKSLLRSPPGSTETSKTSQNAFALCGPGGIGKTQVATEFVFAHRHDYDAVFWISADEKAKISNAFNQISRNLGLLSSDPMAAHDEASSRDIVKAWLANPMTNFAPSRQQKKLARWLLVFDNVDDPDNLIDFWPSGDSGSILITSRDPLAKSNFSIPSTGIDLRPFSVPESAEILTTLTGRTVLQDEREALSKVATRLGGLPLALTQMAPVIVRRHLSFAEFLQLYEEEDNLSRFHKLKLGIDTTGYEHTLESVWALEALSEEGGKLLALISILDPDNINERILAPTGFPEVEPGYPQDLFTYTAARADLLRSSLISLNSSEKIVSVHRIIQDVTRGKMGEDQLSSTFNEGAKRLWYRWSTDLLGFEFHDVERWRLCETVFSHTLRLKQLYESSSTKFQQHCATFEFAKSLIEAGWYTLSNLPFSIGS